MNKVIRMKEISKSFDTVSVLKSVDLDLHEGEVLALAGGNGAGKSTLMKILSGLLKQDSGFIEVNGRETKVATIKQAMDLDISFLHQELNFLPNLTIWENMFLGREIMKTPLSLDIKKMKNITKEKLEQLNIHIDVDTLIEDVSVGEQQFIEIASALLWNKKIIILDEPTSALTEKEVDLLFELIQKQKKEGVSFIYITHRLEEILEIADRVIVLRDGYFVSNRLTTETSISQIVNDMVNQSLEKQYPYSPSLNETTIFEVEDISRNHEFSNVSFELKQGEILGFAGLMGSGRSELMNAIFGINPIESGTIKIFGKDVEILNPWHATKYGLAFVTENRKEEGLVLDFSIKDNFMIPNLDAFSNSVGIINDNRAEKVSQDYISTLNIITESINKKLNHLSGGNQQKVVVGKWLIADPNILILDEPTKGIDVKAKQELYEIMNELKKEGVSILLVSSEIPEVIGISDRIVVMHEGKVKGILSHDDANQERVMTLATGGIIHE